MSFEKMTYRGMPPSSGSGVPTMNQPEAEDFKRSLEAMDILLEIASSVDNSISERIDACRAILGK